jgi:hypothetical protein
MNKFHEEALKELNNICNEDKLTIVVHEKIMSDEKSLINNIIEKNNLDDNKILCKITIIIDNDYIFDNFNNTNMRETIQYKYQDYLSNKKDS